MESEGGPPSDIISHAPLLPLTSSEMIPTPPPTASVPSDAAPRAGGDDDDGRSFRDLLLIASLSDIELLGRILAVVKRTPTNEKRTGGASKSGKIPAKKRAEEFLRTTRGRDELLEIGKGASVGEVLPPEWGDLFDAALRRWEEGGESEKRREGTKQPLHIREIASKLPPDGHRDRLALALRRIREAGASQSLSPPSVREAAGLLRGSALESRGSLRSEALAVLLSALARSYPGGVGRGNLGVFRAVQAPLLRRLGQDALSIGMDAEAAAVARRLMNLDSGESDGEETSSCAGGRRRQHLGSVEESSSMSDVETVDLDDDDLLTTRIVQAAKLARNGTQRGPKHGCVLCVPLGSADGERRFRRIIGRGWNHNVLLRSKSGGPCLNQKRGRSKKSKADKGGNKSKVVLHAEVHAIVDALSQHGEKSCFSDLFPRATAVIVELVGDSAYGDAHPCGGCHTALLGVGVTRAVYSTSTGDIGGLGKGLGRPREELLTRDRVRVPLRAALDERGLRCARFERAEGLAADSGTDNGCER